MTLADAERVAAVYRRESRSLLQYARGADPYAATPAERAAADMVRAFAAAERTAVDALAAVLERGRRAVPPLPAFPPAFTDFNFLAVPVLLRKVVDDQQRGLDQLDGDLTAVADPAARGAVAALRALKADHLERLRTALKPPPDSPPPGGVVI